MSVTIYEDDHAGGDAKFFGDPEQTPDLTNYALDYSYFDTWNDDVSSLYTTEYLYVFEDAYYSGPNALLPPGFHDLAALESYGINNDSISSFYAIYAV
jgi:hypothetical protein